MNRLTSSIKSILLALICGFLGAWGGAKGTNKNWRRILIPSIITLFALCVMHNWWCLSLMLLSIAFSTGYGIPDPTDDGSALGKFWYNFFNNNELRANMATRGTIGLMVNIFLLVLPILKSNWNIYIPCFLVIIAVYIFFSWKDLGGLWVKGKYLLWSDLLVYGTIGIVVATLIFT